MLKKIPNMARRFRGLWTAGGTSALIVGAAMFATPVNAAELYAASVTDNINISMNVAYTCTLTVGPLDLAVYSGLSLEASAEQVVHCSDGASWALIFGGGQQNTGTVESPLRHLRNSSDTFGDYDALYILKDEIGTELSGALASATIAGIGSGADQPRSITAAVPAGQHLLQGAYSDTVVATLHY